MIKAELKKEIQKDIEICQKCLDEKSPDNVKVHHKIVAKYMMVDKDFCTGIPNYVKTIGSNYFSELEAIVEKLKMYLILDDIPIQRNENVALNSVTFNGCKNKIKGNVGQGNEFEQNTDIATEINQEKKSLCGWLKKIFGGK